MIHRYWSKKMLADVGQEKMTDRGLKKKHDRMTPIEHFQIDIVQVLFRGGIEKTVASIGSETAPTDVFQPTLRNFFTSAGRQRFFTGRGSFFCSVLPKKFAM